MLFGQKAASGTMLRMSDREVVFLGTGSQVPTRHRNHNGLFLRWDALGLLIDPGEGTQRQLLHAGIAATQITHILITHFHGDHCLGLAAIAQRISLDNVQHPVEVFFPESGQVFFERLIGSSIYKPQAQLVPRPLPVAPYAGGETTTDELLCCELPEAHARLFARPLHHRVDCVGYRLVEADGVRMLPKELADRQVKGPNIKRLQREGQLVLDGKIVRLEDVSVPRPGQKFAMVQDTRFCQNAVLLAKDADLLVSEATFTSKHAAEAQSHAHMTAGQAGQVAAQAGARRLVLTHFSQRYVSTDVHIEEAKAFFPDVIAAEDLQCVAVPPRKTATDPGQSQPAG